jgi:flagellar basal-body rod protein FlgC
MKRPSLLLAVIPFMLILSQRHEYAYGSEGENYCSMPESQVWDSGFVKFLRARGVKMETDANGLLRIYAHEKPEAISAVVKFHGLMKAWSEVIAENMANIDTVRDSTGKGPYRRKIFSIDKDGNASVSIDEKTSPRIIYMPKHPYADAEGFVQFPNIDLFMEILQLFKASREYCLAESLLKHL